MKKGFTHESTYNESKEWYTPKYIFDALDLCFDMDVCSPGKDVVSWIPAERHLTIADDGLTSNWRGTVWCNPPYGMDTPKWMQKLCKHGDGIALVFSRTDTNWFHDYAAKSDGILFISKRVQFIQSKQAESYAKGFPVKNSGSGAGSMLIAYGRKAMFRLQDAEARGLGIIFTPLSEHPIGESKLSITDRTGDGSGVIADAQTACSYVNSQCNAEPPMGLFDERNTR